MNNRKLIKGILLPIVVACSALTFSPLSMLQAKAAVGSLQQGSSIRGTIVDENGEPIIGATVLVIYGGKTQGTVSDFNGTFVINVKPGTKLKITFIGLKDEIIEAKNGMKVVMKSDGAVNLKAVEVVAYGVQKKVTVTGALSSVKGEDLVRTPVLSVNNILAGQLSGVTTVQYSGEPGSDAATVFVRGQGTWADSAPFIQVDGVERSMGDIDPEDIESITVLKDASATAVFGVRGANGVVLITTKRGQEGNTRIDLSSSFSILQPTKMLEQANSYEYGKFFNQMQRNDFDFSSGEPFTPMFSDVLLEKFKDGSDPIRFPNMRWSDYIMKKSTMQTKHNINISGGTKSMRFFISAGFMTQGGLFKEFIDDFHYDYRYDRFNYRTNLDLDVTPTTTLSFNVAGNVSNSQKPHTSMGASGMIMEMTQSTPFSSPGIIGGRQVITTTDYTDGITLPFVGGNAMTYYNNAGWGGFYHYNDNKLQMDLLLQQKLSFLTKGLLFKVKGSYNSLFAVTKGATVGRATYFPVIQDNGSIAYRKAGENTPPSYEESTGKARDWYFETSLNYNRSFGLHTISGLLLYNQSKTYYPGSYSDIPRGYVGLVGRTTYDWNNRYMAEFNIGYNGSENFPPDRRFGIFPAGSVGWVASDEAFFKPLRRVVSFLKLRASWGLVGNDKIGGSRFMYLSDPYIVNNGTMAARSGWAYNYGIENSKLYSGAYEKSKNNPDVTWEKAFKQDYGVDINFLNDRLRASFDYYKEHRTDILLSDFTAPDLVGFNMPYSNLGIVDSWGWEVSLKWNDKINKNFRYWATLNLSNNKNKIIEKKEAPFNNMYQYEKNHRIGARYMYKFFRFYDADTPRLYEETFGTPFPKQLVDLKDGDAVFVDLDRNGVIDGNDKTRELGYTDDPEYMAGLSFGFSYKDIEFSSQWTGAWNVSRIISDVFRYPFIDRTTKDRGGLLKYHLENTWNPENPGQNYEYPRASWSHGDVNNYQDCSLYEKDAKYLRLKTLMIAYNMHFTFLKKLGVTRAQMALSGYNLLTFTPYIWGDPETRASVSPSYPLQKTYTISLKLNF